MFINILVRMLQGTETLILYFFAHENMKKKTSKVIYFDKIAEIFRTALMAQSAPKQQNCKINLSFYITGVI